VKIDAMLCDAATVREGLLNVLGGGITQLWREQFPAPLGVQLAMLLHCPAAEAAQNRKMTISLRHESSQKAAELAVDFQMASAAPSVRPETIVTVPLVANFQAQMVPLEGNYVIDLAVDGQVLKTIDFMVAKPPQRVPAGSAKG